MDTGRAGRRGRPGRGHGHRPRRGQPAHAVELPRPTGGRGRHRDTGGTRLSNDDANHGANHGAQPIHLLWTGGWDSTYRLLALAVEHQLPVQPYYAYNGGRRSAAHELEARHAILAALAEGWPEAAARIRPSIIVDKDELPDDPDLRASFERLMAEHPMGDQYIYLGLMVRQLGIDGLELSIHHDDLAERAIRGHTEVVADHPTPGVHRLRTDAPPDHALFAPFHLPLVEMTKAEMGERARQLGVLDVLERSWFCHEPLRGQPCGRCNPCVTTRRDGLAHRVPTPRSVRGGAARLRHAAARTRHHAGRTRARVKRRWRGRP